MIIREHALNNDNQETRFADDLVLLAENFNDLQGYSTTIINDASKQVGLKMNMSKSKVTVNISNVANPIEMEIVDQYLYLGRILSFGKQHQTKEILRRIQIRWAVFGKLEDICKSVECLDTRLYNQCNPFTMT